MNQHKLIRDLAVKYNKPVSEIQKAVNSQFRFVANKMPELAEIRLPYFGVFKVNEKKLKKIKQINDDIHKENRTRKAKESP